MPRVQEKLTDEEIIERYKPKVFGIYARNVLQNRANPKELTDPEKIRTHEIHNHGTSVKRIVRILCEEDVLIRRGYNCDPRINLSIFNKEAIAIARLEPAAFQLNLENVFLKSMGKDGVGTTKELDKKTLHKVGGRKISGLHITTALWAYFNPNLVYFDKLPAEHHQCDEYYLFLKGREEEIVRFKLLKVLFEELKNRPTEYLAGYCETKWVGHIKKLQWVNTHGALDIIKSPAQVIKAEREIRRLSNHYLAYANMLNDISTKLDIKNGDRAEQTTGLLKYMIKTMLKKAPLNLQSDCYKTTLENASAFTFENLFPEGLTKDQIVTVLRQM